MGPVHSPSRWQNELQDDISSAIRVGFLCASTADLSALQSRGIFLRDLVSKAFPPQVATTAANRERLNSELLFFLTEA